MGKLFKLLKALTLVIKQPSLLNNVLNDVGIHQEEIIKKYNLPHGLAQVNISDLIGTDVVTIKPFAFLSGGSRTSDMALLKGLASKNNVNEYLEIGTWRGESAAIVSEAAKHCTTINLPDEEMRKMNLPEKYIQLHRYFSKNKSNITHISANSLTFDFKSLNKKFDLIFIDGDHHYESVVSDTRKVFELLKDESSIIVWHDYSNDTEDIRWDVLHGILEGSPADKQKNIYKVSNTLCAIYTSQPILSKKVMMFDDPNKYFEVTLIPKAINIKQPRRGSI